VVEHVTTVSRQSYPQQRVDGNLGIPVAIERRGGAVGLPRCIARVRVPQDVASVDLDAAVLLVVAKVTVGGLESLLTKVGNHFTVADKVGIVLAVLGRVTRVVSGSLIEPCAVGHHGGHAIHAFVVYGDCADSIRNLLKVGNVRAGGIGHIIDAVLKFHSSPQQETSRPHKTKEKSKVQSLLKTSPTALQFTNSSKPAHHKKRQDEHSPNSRHIGQQKAHDEFDEDNGGNLGPELGLFGDPSAKEKGGEACSAYQDASNAKEERRETVWCHGGRRGGRFCKNVERRRS